MNRRILARFKAAAKYQKQALYALLPDNVGGHLDVVEKELKMMAVETASDLLNEYRKWSACGPEPGQEKEAEVKKVDIE